jgi:hypothetical protein
MKVMIALVALMVAVPAAAADPATGDGKAGAATPKKERKICRREETSTGLYASRSICLTAEEWHARDHHQEDIDPRASGNAGH